MFVLQIVWILYFDGYEAHQNVKTQAGNGLEGVSMVSNNSDKRFKKEIQKIIPVGT